MRLDRIETEQTEPIDAAARAIVRAMDAGSRTFVFGSGHSNLLAADVFNRAGGMPIFNPIFVPGLLPTDLPPLRGTLLERTSGIARAVLDTSPLRRGDVLIVISNSGRNHVPVEMALEAKDRGATVIALTSLEMSSESAPRHASGKRLFEIADIVLDNCCPPGDGSVDVPGIPARVGPVSTVLGSVVLHMVVCRITELLIETGKTPPVFISGNVDGGEEYGKNIMDEYKHLMTY